MRLLSSWKLKAAAIRRPASESNCVDLRTVLIFDLLHPGAENGIKLSELVKLTGQEERIVRRRIQAERKAGKLILSDCLHGYFLPASEQEARRFIRSMSGRAAEIAAVSRAAEAALADMDGQEHMEGWV